MYSTSQQETHNALKQTNSSVRGTCPRCVCFVHRRMSTAHYHLYLRWTNLQCLPLIPLLLRSWRGECEAFQRSSRIEWFFSQRKKGHGHITISKVHLLRCYINQAKCIPGSFYIYLSAFALRPITKQLSVHVTLWKKKYLMVIQVIMFDHE